MAIFLLLRMAAVGISMIVIPITYLSMRHFFFLNEVETAVLEDNVTLVINDDNPPSSAVVKTSAQVTAGNNSSSYYWECKITTTGLGESDNLKEYLNKKLPTATNNTEEIRKTNKKKLVWACSKNRKEINENTYKTELKLIVTKQNNKIYTNLFGIDS